MKQMKFIAFGDSLTYGYGVLEPVAYPARLTRELPKKSQGIQWEIRNCGINGDTSREAPFRMEQNLIRFRPQIAAVLLGSNDSALNEGQYRTLWEFKKNMTRIIERIFAAEHDDPDFNNGHCLPLLITPPPVVDTDFFPFTTTDRIEAYRDAVLELAKRYGCPVIDLFAVFMEKKAQGSAEDYEDLFQFDGIHLSDAGYDVLYPPIRKRR